MKNPPQYLPAEVRPRMARRLVERVVGGRLKCDCVAEQPLRPSDVDRRRNSVTQQDHEEREQNGGQYPALRESACTNARISQRPKPGGSLLRRAHRPAPL